MILDSGVAVLIPPVEEAPPVLERSVLPDSRVLVHDQEPPVVDSGNHRGDSNDAQQPPNSTVEDPRNLHGSHFEFDMGPIRVRAEEDAHTLVIEKNDRFSDSDGTHLMTTVSPLRFEIPSRTPRPSGRETGTVLCQGTTSNNYFFQVARLESGRILIELRGEDYPIAQLEVSKGAEGESGSLTWIPRAAISFEWFSDGPRIELDKEPSPFFSSRSFRAEKIAKSL